MLKRLKFPAKSECHSSKQRNLLEEELDCDLAPVEHEIEQLRPAPPATVKQQPRRTAAGPSQRGIHHEPTSTTRRCGYQLMRIGEDMAEKLVYAPGVFTVERHVRGKWARAQCQIPHTSPRGRSHLQQRHPGERIAGAGAGGQVRRSLTPVPSGEYLWSRC